jgi:hypothetical protein
VRRNAAVAAVIFAFVMDNVDLGRISVNAACLVGDDGVGLPGVPKLVAHFHVLFEPLVTPASSVMVCP